MEKIKNKEGKYYAVECETLEQVNDVFKSCGYDSVNVHFKYATTDDGATDDVEGLDNFEIISYKDWKGVSLNISELYRVHCLLNKYNEESGYRLDGLSAQGTASLEDFLEWFSFKINGDVVCYFNDDYVPYGNGDKEDDFNYLPITTLLSGNLSDEDVKKFFEYKIKEQESFELEEIKIDLEHAKRKVQHLEKTLTQYLNNN